MGTIKLPEISTPATPPTDVITLFADTNKQLSFVDDNGNTTKFSNKFEINNVGTGNYTLVASDGGKLVTGNDSSAQTFTVPDGTFGTGTVITIMQLGTGQITISAGTGQTINNRQGHTKTAGQYATIAITQYSADVWMLTGDTA